MGVLFLILTSVAVYVAAAWRQRPRGRRWNPWRTASFMGGMALLATALSPPVVDLAHYDFRGHVAQHLLIGMLAPVGLALAAPLTLLLRTLPVAASRRLTALLRSRPARWLSQPFTALALNLGGMYLLYLSPLYAATLAYPLLHQAMHLHFLAAGYLFASAVAGLDPAPHRPGLRTRLVLLFMAMAAHATLAKLIYAYLWPRGTLHSSAKIRAGAQLMNYGGDFAELLLAVALFGTWYALRRRHAGKIAAGGHRPRARNSGGVDVLYSANASDRPAGR